MQYSVSTAALLETTDCKSFYSCLFDEKTLCKVTGARGARFLLLESDQHKECPYWFSFFYDTVCICPVHAELFAKYKV